MPDEANNVIEVDFSERPSVIAHPGVSQLDEDVLMILLAAARSLAASFRETESRIRSKRDA
jgi:hypothetical protein